MLRTNDKSKVVVFNSIEAARSFISQSEGGTLCHMTDDGKFVTICNPPHYEYLGPKSMGVRLYVTDKDHS